MVLATHLLTLSLSCDRASRDASHLYNVSIPNCTSVVLRRIKVSNWSWSVLFHFVGVNFKYSATLSICFAVQASMRNEWNHLSWNVISMRTNFCEENMLRETEKLRRCRCGTNETNCKGNSSAEHGNEWKMQIWICNSVPSNCRILYCRRWANEMHFNAITCMANKKFARSLDVQCTSFSRETFLFSFRVQLPHNFLIDSLVLERITCNIKSFIECEFQQSYHIVSKLRTQILINGIQNSSRMITKTVAIKVFSICQLLQFELYSPGSLDEIPNWTVFLSPHPPSATGMDKCFRGRNKLRHEIAVVACQRSQLKMSPKMCYATFSVSSPKMCDKNFVTQKTKKKNSDEKKTVTNLYFASLACETTDTPENLMLPLVTTAFRRMNYPILQRVSIVLITRPTPQFVVAFPFFSIHSQTPHTHSPNILPACYVQCCSIYRECR